MKTEPYIHAVVYDPLNPTAKFNPKDPILKRAKAKLSEITGKILKLEVEKFREEEKPSLNDAKLFGFKTQTDIAALKNYLASEQIMVQSGSSNEEEEKKAYTYHSTRYFETVGLAFRVAKRRREGKTYKQIAAEFNQQLERLGTKYRVKPGTLRRLINKTFKKIDKEKLQYFMAHFP